MIYIINSKTNDRIKRLVDLKQSKTRDEEQAFLIEGFHLLEMALDANVVKEIYTIKELDIRDDIDQYLISEDILEKISTSKSPQGVVAKCSYLPVSNRFGTRILFLDGVSDPGNVGTIIRTAVAFGFNDILLGEKTASLYNEKVISASQGAMFKANIVKGTLQDIINFKDLGFDVVGASLHKATTIEKMKVNDKVLLVLGSEAHGISTDIMNLLTQSVIIPICDIESLNVGVAAAIMMYEINKGNK